MNLLKIFFFSIIAISGVSCGSSSNENPASNENPISTWKPPENLSWKPPENFENGDQLSSSVDLLEYKVYYAETLENISDNVISVDPNLNKYEFNESDFEHALGWSSLVIGMTSVSKNGIESSLSEVVYYSE